MSYHSMLHYSIVLAVVGCLIYDLPLQSLPFLPGLRRHLPGRPTCHILPRFEIDRGPSLGWFSRLGREIRGIQVPSCVHTSWEPFASSSAQTQDESDRRRELLNFSLQMGPVGPAKDVRHIFSADDPARGVLRTRSRCIGRWRSADVSLDTAFRICRCRVSKLFYAFFKFFLNQLNIMSTNSRRFFQELHLQVVAFIILEVVRLFAFK